jgi:hypothetical protein
VKDDFPEKLSRAIRYSMDTVTNLLEQLNHPDHNATRWGHPDRSDFRGVVADALQDNGRDQEADLLRSGKHVVVHEGKVKPGRFTWEHLGDAMHAADHTLFNPTAMPPSQYRRTMQVSPGIDWTPADGVDYTHRQVEERLNQPHLDDTNRADVHHEDGIPHVGMVDDTCARDDVPITGAAQNYKDHILTPQLRWIEHHLGPMSEEERQGYLNHPLVQNVLKAPFEEPVPEEGK